MILSAYGSPLRRCALPALLLLPLCVRGQALPATAPTASVSQLPSAQPAVSRATSHLSVLWDGVALQIEASNVSLNAVLHEVGQKTRMQITGSAPEERVFGSYGPGPMNLVVPALLKGVSVNVLLTERQGGAADELTLTDRNGGATPSYVPIRPDEGNPQNAAVPAQRQPALQNTRGAFAGRRPPAGNDPVVPDNGINGRDNGISGPNNGINGTDNGINGGNNGLNGTDNGLNNSNASVNSNSSIDNSNASPNGVKTPQEIFEQLQKLRQQSQTPQ